MGVCTSNLPTSHVRDVHSYDLSENVQFLDVEDVPDPQIVESISDVFIKRRVIQQTKRSVVFEVTRKSDGKIFVLKQMFFDSKSKSLFENEFNVLSTIIHPNIVKFEGGYISNNNLYISTHLCNHGRLFDRLKKNGPYSESMASDVIRTVLETINWCHQHNLVHRDLKLGNIMYSQDENAENDKVVIIDWGDSMIVNDNKTYSHFTGTPNYSAPELLRKCHGWELKKSDLFAIGVITFGLLTETFPFRKENLKKLAKHGMKVPWPPNIKISKDAKNFVNSLLEINTKKRMSAVQALSHPWIVKYLS